jgi:hypothetical protein
MNKTKTTTILICAVIGISAHAQNLLLNGSFESPSIAPNTYNGYSIPTYWQTGPDGVGMVNGVSSYGGVWPLPEDGEQYAVLGNPGIGDSLSQVFTITDQGYYVLSWFGSAPIYDDGATNSPYSLTVSNASQVVVTSNFDDYNNPPAWVSNSMQMMLSSGQYTLTFQCEAAARLENTLLDNVSLLATGQTKGVTITTEPQSQVGYWGQSVTFSVTASPISPPLSYQWLSNNLPISGATNQTLLLTNLQNSFAAAYTVVVTSLYGSVTSSPPANLTISPAAVAIALYTGLQIGGVVGQTYGIQYSTNLVNTNGWIGVTNLTLTTPMEIWYDSVPASLSQRFYKVLEGPISIP